MPIYSRRANISTGKLRREDVEAMVDAARGVRGVAAGFGVEAYPSRGGVEFRLDPDVENQSMIRHRFLARIAPNGPNLESDFPDARYWVREIIDLSGQQAQVDSLPNFKFYDDWAVAVTRQDKEAVDAAREASDDPEAAGLREEEDLVEPRPAYWYPAVNLTELGRRSDGTHGMAVDTMVEVHLAQNMAGRWLFYFLGGGSGSAIRFGVVRDIFDGNGTLIEVEGVEFRSDHELCMANPQNVETFPVLADREDHCLHTVTAACFADPAMQVRFPDDDERTNECLFDRLAPKPRFDGQPSPVSVWPGFRASHYAGFVSTTEKIVPRTQIIPIINIEGIWYAQQLPRWKTHRLPVSARITDCSLVQFVAGLLGRRQQ